MLATTTGYSADNLWVVDCKFVGWISEVVPDNRAVGEAIIGLVGGIYIQVRVREADAGDRGD